MTLLLKKGNQADASYNIGRPELRARMLGSDEPQLLPEKRPGEPCPVMGCVDINNEAAVSQWIADQNAFVEKDFQRSVQEYKAQHPEDPILNGPLPATRITFSNNARIERVDYEWQLLDGSTLRTYDYARVPDFFAIQIRKMGEREFYRWVQAFSMAATAYPEDVAPSKGVYLAGIAAEQWKMQDYIKVIMDTPGYGFMIQQFTNNFREFWTEWKHHSESPQKRGEPFKPPHASDIPYLNFFAPPLEWYERRGDDVSGILLFKKGSEFDQKIKSGELVSPANPSPP